MVQEMSKSHFLRHSKLVDYTTLDHSRNVSRSSDAPSWRRVGGGDRSPPRRSVLGTERWSLPLCRLTKGKAESELAGWQELLGKKILSFKMPN